MLAKAPVYPERSKRFYLERLGKEVTLYEMSVGFKVKLDEDESLGTPENILLDAGMEKEDILRLGTSTLVDLYWEVLELTYPGAKARMENSEEQPSEKEIKDSKKNS